MATTVSEAAIFERIVMPDEPGMSNEAAKSILAMGFSSGDRDRMQILAERAREGSLTPDEREEIDSYERVGHYLGILHSKARIAIKRNTQSGS